MGDHRTVSTQKWPLLAHLAPINLRHSIFLYKGYSLNPLTKPLKGFKNVTSRILTFTDNISFVSLLDPISYFPIDTLDQTLILAILQWTFLMQKWSVWMIMYMAGMMHTYLWINKESLYLRCKKTKMILLLESFVLFFYNEVKMMYNACSSWNVSEWQERKW